MNRCIVLVFCAVVVGLTGADEVKDFSPKDSGLKIKMPGEPKLVEQEVAGTTVKTWFLERNGGKEGFGVSIADIAGSADDDDNELQTRLDGARDGMLKNIKGTLVKETKITFDKKYPGRDVVASLKDDALIRNQFYLVKGRMYQVLVVGNKEFVESEEAKKYLQSFALTK